MEVPAIEKKPSFFKKYGLFLCIPLFLGIAYWYISGLYPKYKVTAIISVKDVPATSAVSEIRSKDLVKKTLGLLPYEASFFKAGSPKLELNYDSVPVKFVFSKYDNANKENSIQIQLTGGRQFTLTNGDTTSFHKFNEQINEPYGTFTVLPNPQMLQDTQNYIVRLTEPARLLDRYYKKLSVKPEQHGTVAVSILAGTPRIGADFLNTLFHEYNAAHPGMSVAAPVQAINNDASEKIRREIASLENRAAVFKKDIARLKKNGTDQAANDDLEETPDDLLQISDKDQVKMYKDIKPYMKKPIGQFVQIPHADEIGDPDLNEEINDFNEQEVYRQRLFATEKPTATQTDSVNKKLMLLQSVIVQKVNAFLKDENAYNNRSHRQLNPGELIQSKEASLALLDRNIAAAADRYRTTKKTEEAKVQIPVPGSKLTVVERPEENVQYLPVNTLLIYLIAFLAGLAIPLLWLLIRRWSDNGPPHLINNEKLNGKLNDILAVKQID